MMHRLTVRQPWAWLIAEGYKDFENRGVWSAFSGEILIHAGLQPADNYDLIRLNIFNEHGIRVPKFEELKTGGFVAKALFEKYTEASESDWFEGVGGWPIFSAERTKFVKFRGQQYIFDVPESIRSQLAA